MGMAAPLYHTADMVRALPDDGGRYETVHGELLVTPAPRPLHQIVLERVRGAVWSYLQHHPVGMMLSAPADLSWGPDVLVQPDLFVIRRDPSRPVVSWSDVGIPVLAVEILSPGTASQDRGAKRRLYQRAGVAEYWIVDQDARLIERWRPDDVRPEVLDETLVWDDGGREFTIDVTALFR